MAKILIADDAAFMRMKSATLLRELGQEVLEAEDGQQAVDMFTEHTPDAVLLDITMPVKDGMDALREIMGMNPQARVAMVTAMGQQQVIMEAIEAGAKDFVVKPFDADRIQSALWKLVG